MPIHVEGHTAWKEIQAVGDFLMESSKHARLFREKLSGGGATSTPEVNTDIKLRTGNSQVSPTKISPHHHEITLTRAQVSKLKSGGYVKITTSQNNGHQHTITVKWHKKRGFYIALCASTPDITEPFSNKCQDKHPAILTKVANK